MRCSLLLAGCLAVAAFGCEAKKARVKGVIVENGQPRTFSAFTTSVGFSFINAEGKPGEPSFTNVVNEDGSFEVVVSGGELPVGNYEVVVDARTKATAKKSGTVTFRRELKPGPNELTLDLAKPDR